MDDNDNTIRNIINNGGFNLNPVGSEGRYTRSHHFQNMDEWDMLFSYIIATPTPVYETSQFVYSRAVLANITQRTYEYNTFPEVVLIPLPCTLSNFKRCILHVEEFDTATNYLTGRFTPIHLTYHMNHPIAQGMTRMFELEAHTPPSFQRNEDLVFMTIPDPTAIELMCRCLVQPMNNFDAYDALVDPNEYESLFQNGGSRHILPDPRAQKQANAAILAMMPVPERELTMRESHEQKHQWGSIVFPRGTVEERRNAYAQHAAEQINTHRYLRILWGNNYPVIPNPIDLPHNFEIVIDRNRRPHEHVCENNPADREPRRRGEHHIQGNAFIQALYDAQNNDERARIAAMDARVGQNVFPPHVSRL